MKKITPLFILILLTMSTLMQAKRMYPQSFRDTVYDLYYGVKVEEPYRWLEDDRSTQTEEWVKQQNTLTQSYLSTIPFRSEIKDRLTELMDYPKYGSPSKHNGKYYFFKNDGLQNQSVLFELDDLNADPKVLLDPNKLSNDGTVALSGLSISNDGKYLAYSISKSGSDWTEIYIMDIASRTLLNDHVEWVKFSGISWKGNGFYYSAYEKPEAGKEYSGKNEFHKIYYHELGKTQSEDQIVFEDKEHPLRNCGASVSEDENYLFISQTESTSGNSLYLKDLTKPNSPIQLVAEGFEFDYSVVEHYEGKIYVVTNRGASNQQLMAIDPENPQVANWSTVIPESSNVLETVSIIGGKFFVKYMQDASHHLYAYTIQGQKLYEIELPTIGTVGISGNMDEKEAFYTFTSFTYPPTIYKYDVENNKSELFKKSEAKFNADDYATEQVFYTSKDGTKVPMSIIYKKGMKKDGKNPLMLYGYGGFNISLNPSFSVGRIPFLEKGGIYVIANTRGGGEYGEDWHEAGTKLKKQNVFDDFISAAEYLIQEGYTNSKKLAIDGGSNGGLLVGACMTQRPDLFAVCIPEVGVLDMLKYQKFTIGWAWATDYGTVDDSEEMFRYLHAYSPLHNLKAGVQYPATMVMTGDHDDRVVPAHSFKFAATLQHVQTGENPTLIRIDTKAGHGAGKPTAKIIEAQADMWSFVMYHLGMN